MTFGKNYALIQAKYAEIHKEQLADDKSQQPADVEISKYGYPDMGNNLYSDELPYKDWVKVNNAQRCHENLTVHLAILYPAILINALSFPAFTCYLTGTYCAVRFSNIRSWNSSRGYNKALVSEEILRFLVLVYLMGAFRSSIRLIRRLK